MQGGTPSVERIAEIRDDHPCRKKKKKKKYLGPNDNARLEHHLWLGAKVFGFPQDEVGDLAHLDRSDVCADPVRDRTIGRKKKKKSGGVVKK